MGGFLVSFSTSFWPLSLPCFSLVFEFFLIVSEEKAQLYASSSFFYKPALNCIDDVSGHQLAVPSPNLGQGQSLLPL